MFVILARFSPISKAEISSLHVSVSILVGFEEANNYLDWEVGHQISNIYCKAIFTLYISKFKIIIKSSNHKLQVP